MAKRAAKSAKHHCLKPAGEMTIYNAVDTKKTLLESLHNYEEVGVDLSRISEIDTAGLQLLVLARREAAMLGKKLRLINISDPVMEIFNLYRLTEDFSETGPNTENAV